MDSTNKLYSDLLPSNRSLRFSSVCTVLLYLLSLVEERLCRDVLPQDELYLPDYRVYHNLSRIQSHLEDIVQNNPNYMKIDWSYTSRQSRPQLVLHVTNFSDSEHIQITSRTLPNVKLKVLLSYGEHAREFLPVESMFFFLQNITNGLRLPESNPGFIYSQMILNQMDLFIVVMMNPDGRRYVEKTGNYCWRGTSTGVDLNRNFDWNFGAKGSSADVTDEEYRGKEAFSEPEGLVLVELTSRYGFDAFISFHSGIRQIYVPFADSYSKQTQRKPNNIAEMMELANRISEASVRTFTYGLAYQLNEYTADGTIFDYMAGKRKIPYSFAIELWGDGSTKGSKCFDLFNPTSQQLLVTLQDIHPLYVTLFQYLIQWKEKQILALSDPLEEAPSLTFSLILLVAVIFCFVLVALHNKLPACMRLYPRRRIISLRALSSTFSVVSLLKP